MLASSAARRVSSAAPSLTRSLATFNPQVHREKMVTAWTTKESRQYFDRISEVIASRYSIGMGLGEVKPINWDTWTKQIEDKEFVKKVKKDYEAMDFNLYSGKEDPSEKAEWKQLEELAKKRVDFLNEQLDELNTKLAQAIYDRECVAHFDAFHFYDRMPGLEQEHKAEFVSELYLPSAEDQELDKLDMQPFIKQLSEGVEPSIREVEGIEKVGVQDFKSQRAEFLRKYEATGGNLLEKAAKIIERQVEANGAIMAAQQEKVKAIAAQEAAAATAFKTSQQQKFRLEAEAVRSEEQLTLASRKALPSAVQADYLKEAVRVINSKGVDAGKADTIRQLAAAVLGSTSWKSGSAAEKAAEQAVNSVLGKKGASADELLKVSDALQAVMEE